MPGLAQGRAGEVQGGAGAREAAASEAGTQGPPAVTGSGGAPDLGLALARTPTLAPTLPPWPPTYSGRVKT